MKKAVGANVIHGTVTPCKSMDKNHVTGPGTSRNNTIRNKPNKQERNTRNK